VLPARAALGDVEVGRDGQRRAGRRRAAAVAALAFAALTFAGSFGFMLAP